jgi:ribonuclease MRP protein subunit RMP1
MLMTDVNRAFSNLTADNQFAPLGLMLLGCLARARMVVGGLKGEDVEKAEDGGGNEQDVLAEERQDDVGEVVKRDEVVEQTYEGEQEDGIKVRNSKKQKRKKDAPDKAQKEVGDSTPLKRLKKKRKKGDAFDDLFSSLI